MYKPHVLLSFEKDGFISCLQIILEKNCTTPKCLEVNKNMKRFITLKIYQIDAPTYSIRYKYIMKTNCTIYYKITNVKINIPFNATTDLKITN